MGRFLGGKTKNVRDTRPLHPHACLSYLPILWWILSLFLQGTLSRQQGLAHSPPDEVCLENGMNSNLLSPVSVSGQASSLEKPLTSLKSFARIQGLLLPSGHFFKDPALVKCTPHKSIFFPFPYPHPCSQPIVIKEKEESAGNRKPLSMPLQIPSIPVRSVLSSRFFVVTHLHLLQACFHSPSLLCSGCGGPSVPISVIHLGHPFSAP